MNRTLIATVVAMSLCGIAAFAVAGGEQQAKNLQILPKNTPMPQLKAMMKGMAKSLGVQCDFCHDTDDFAKDTDMKKTGRWMMTLTKDINAKFQGRDVVTCGTCHNGHDMPPMGGADLEKDRAKAAAQKKK